MHFLQGHGMCETLPFLCEHYLWPLVFIVRIHSLIAERTVAHSVFIWDSHLRGDAEVELSLCFAAT